jgi:uncharacterized repeat protein (TIGR02543 family)
MKSNSKLITLLWGGALALSIFCMNSSTVYAETTMPNTTHTYDTDVTLSTHLFTGRSWEIKFNGNKPTTSNNITNASNDVTDIPSTKTGNLQFDKWKITNADNNNNDEVAEATNLGKKNYKTTQDAVATATAQWETGKEWIFSTPKLKGWVFEGWYRGIDSSSTKITESDPVTIIPATSAFSTTLYAHWRPIGYTIVYDGGIGIGDKNIKGDSCTQATTGSTASTGCQYDIKSYIASSGFSKTGYLFIGWSRNKNSTTAEYQPGDTILNWTTTDNDTITLYAVWQPIEYSIKFNGNSNWNSQNNYTQTLLFDRAYKLTKNKFSRPDRSVLSTSPYQYGYEFLGWRTSEQSKKTAGTLKNIDGTSYTLVDEATVKNLTSVNKKEIEIFAVWRKQLTLTFNMNNDSGQTEKMYNNNPGDIKIKTYIYDNQYSYAFNIVGSTTTATATQDSQAVKLNTETEFNKTAFDAFCSYDEDGLNSMFRYRDSRGQQYRFLGWSTNKEAVVPDAGLSILDHNSTYTISDDTTLYAIWEPVLKIDLSLYRTLGTLCFSTGDAPNTTVQSVTNATSNPSVETVIKAGEQGTYIIQSVNDNVSVKVEFDRNMTNIYDTLGIWTDELNPSTEENLLGEAQTNGLNRQLPVFSNGAIARKFYVPQYLGTDQSYEGNTGIYAYNVKFTIGFVNEDGSPRPSYFWKTKTGEAEEIVVNGTIHTLPTSISGSPTGGDTDDNRVSILNDLKVRIRQ